MPVASRARYELLGLRLWGHHRDVEYLRLAHVSLMNTVDLSNKSRNVPFDLPTHN
jgi:hypothetical protein